MSPYYFSTFISSEFSLKSLEIDIESQELEQQDIDKRLFSSSLK
jgi:hypothetical protein